MFHCLPNSAFTAGNLVELAEIQNQSKPNRASNLLCQCVHHCLGSALPEGGTAALRLGWVDFDLRVTPCCPAALPILPDFYPPKQNRADSGRPKPSQRQPILVRPPHLDRAQPVLERLQVGPGGCERLQDGTQLLVPALWHSTNATADQKIQQLTTGFNS